MRNFFRNLPDGFRLQASGFELRAGSRQTELADEPLGDGRGRDKGAPLPGGAWSLEPGQGAQQTVIGEMGSRPPEGSPPEGGHDPPAAGPSLAML